MSDSSIPGNICVLSLASVVIFLFLLESVYSNCTQNNLASFVCAYFPLSYVLEYSNALFYSVPREAAGARWLLLCCSIEPYCSTFFFSWRFLVASCAV